MRSPLALIEVPHQDHVGHVSREWLVLRTAASAVGYRAYRVVYVRAPTLGERSCVESALLPSDEENRVFHLSEVLERPVTDVKLPA